MPGLTLKQFAARRFSQTLAEYREALASRDPARLLRASVAIHHACRNPRDRAAVNRAFNEPPTPTP
jgi:predicted nucleic acid-binding protein